MGRRRRKRGRHGSEAAKLAANLYQRGLERAVDDALLYQGCKESHSAHAKEVAQREQELLSRTIFVSNVKNLREGRNLVLLEQFFEKQYGPVELCMPASFSGKKGKYNKFPQARVRFRHVHDAQRIFGGKKLSLVQRDQDPPIQIHNYVVGHKGFLRIQPSERYPNMDETSHNEDKVSITGENLRIGHWSPAEADEYVYAGYEERGEDNLFLIEDVIQEQVEFSIDITSRTVQVRLKDSLYMLSFRFKDLQGTMSVFRDESSYAIAFRLKYPPRIYHLAYEQDQDGVLEEIATRCVETCKVRRETFGSCYGYMVKVSRYYVGKFFESEGKLRKMKQFGLLSRDIYVLDDAPIVAIRPVGGDKSRVDLFLQRIADRHVGLMLRSLMDSGRFCWFHALHDKASTPDGEMNIFELVESVPSVRGVNVLEKMAAMTWPTRYPANSFQAIMMLEVDESDVEDEVFPDIPDYCTRTPRLLITPTRLAVTGFSVEMSNRVVRHFLSREGFEPESFLRVSIGEENGARLFSDQLSLYVQARIKGLMLRGLTLNGREYRFLAYSSSQLKEASLWMVDATGAWDVASIRKWMGDFSKCETPSKVAARMGQCFSTTVVASEAKNNNLSLHTKDDFSDILSNYKGKEMCHSDGTGMIERRVLVSLIDRLPLGPSDPTEVSMIQVRFGGAKGTLTAWDFREVRTLIPLPLPRNCNVLLRPSMVKFKAPYRQLEVISIGKQIPYYLNRNVILLLGVHGVQDEVFLGMQRLMLDNLDAMLTDPTKAMQMIPRLSGPDSCLSSSLLHMLSCGLSPCDEPFLFSCIHAIRAHHLMTLRKKSRVFVDKGAVLLGGLDETGLVPEGCVFLQIRPEGVAPERNANIDDTGFEVLTGPVMVTKHPVMHPGDVRMLLAVDIPELRAHKNCILFSRHGDRPEADKMAGSDLDGDQFAVTWDERLFLGEWNGCVRQSSGKWQSSQGKTLLMQSSTMTDDARILQLANCNPMDFDPDTILSQAPLLLLSKKSDAMDDNALIAHFINHAINDNLGQIAMMWLDYAAKNGADCEACLKLAGLHSIAVDFPKSGKPATIPKDLFIPRTTPRAHWREKKGLPSYHCAGPIGQMYDQVVKRMGNDKGASDTYALPLAGRRLDNHGQILRFLQPDSAKGVLAEIYNLRIPIGLGLDLKAAAHPNSKDLDLIEEAMDRHHEYEKGLVKLMCKYGLQCEGELLTGCIRKYHKLDKKRQHDLSETVRTQCRELRSNHRRSFFSFVLYTVCPKLKDNIIDDETVDSWVDHVEATCTAVTGKALLSEGNMFSEQEYGDFVVLARKLAAAYYVATYNPEIRWNRSVLFSFPWIVADVIAAGLRS